MSSPKPDLLTFIDEDPEAQAQTSLIARLANEFYSGASSTQAPVTVPTAIAGVPSTTSPAEPAPVSSSTSRDISLNGGFPNASSSSPVHPTVVAAEPEPASGKLVPPSGAHRQGASDSFEYGEPRLYSESFGLSQSEPQVSNLIVDRSFTSIPASPSFPQSPGGTEEPAYYFLSHLTSVQEKDATPPLSAFDVEGVRRDFPALHQRVNGHPLIWLDNAATTQKPQSVIDATSLFYSRDNSNIHRAAYVLAERATRLFEAGREKVRQFLGAADAKEIVFVRGTTEGINLVANSYGRQNVGAGDEILLTRLEHHANIVPWQLLAQQTGAVIRVAPINDRGELILEEFAKLLNAKTKIVSIAHVSNSLGTVNPVEQIIPLAHAVGAVVVVDGAQSTPHLPVNVQALDADFYVFSGHKVFGPTGIGALYGKAHLLEAMPPWQGGGHMIKDVTFERTVYQHAPEKFEAGTPDIAGVVGLGAAIDYLFRVGIPAIAAYEHSLLEYATQALATVPGLKPIGTATNKASVLSFVIPGLQNDAIARHLDKQGIAVRAGHHCSLPAQRHFGLESTVRPSLAFYNTYAEVDSLVAALHQLPRR